MMFHPPTRLRTIVLLGFTALVSLSLAASPGRAAAIDELLPPLGDDEPQATAELLADVDAIVPGQTFRLGVLYRILPEWHIYWRNSGDSGMPTSIRLDLPEGFTLSDMHWPAPSRYVEPGDIVSFGYSNEVLLWFEVTAPDNLETGRPLLIEGHSDWLVCKDECIIGGQGLSLMLPVRESRGSDNEAVFARWEAKLPRPADKADDVSAAITHDRQGNDLRATIELQWSADSPEELELFPGIIENMMAVRTAYRQENGLTIIDATWRVIGPLPKSGPPLVLVAAYQDAQGRRQALEITIPTE